MNQEPVYRFLIFYIAIKITGWGGTVIFKEYYNIMKENENKLIKLF